MSDLSYCPLLCQATGPTVRQGHQDSVLWTPHCPAEASKRPPQWPVLDNPSERQLVQITLGHSIAAKIITKGSLHENVLAHLICKKCTDKYNAIRKVQASIRLLSASKETGLLPPPPPPKKVQNVTLWKNCQYLQKILKCLSPRLPWTISRFQLEVSFNSFQSVSVSWTQSKT